MPKKKFVTIGFIETILLASAGVLWLSWLYPMQSGFVGFWVVNFFIKNCIGDTLAILPALLCFFVVMSFFKQLQEQTKPFSRFHPKAEPINFFWLSCIGFVCSISAFLSLHTFDSKSAFQSGAIIGNTLSNLLILSFGSKGAYFILATVMLIFLSIMLPISFFELIKRFVNIVFFVFKTIYLVFRKGVVNSAFFWRERVNKEDQEAGFLEHLKKRNSALPKDFSRNLPEVIAGNALQVDTGESKKKIKSVKKTELINSHLNDSEYQLPPIDLLEMEALSKTQIKDRERLALEKASVLEAALASFNVKAAVVHISAGPSVTRYELKPGDGVKISKITTLAQDIALKMAAPSVRIEAPIPGKSLVGIEVPSAKRDAVLLRQIIEQSQFLNDSSLLMSALGLTITGEPITFNLGEMPHILIAGATGSGKSVCVNTIIMSILLKAKPDQVKFVMIDPKKVELSLYNDIPHLLAPVVTNPHLAAATLKQWALREMEQRYELFSNVGVKDLAGYNKACPENPLPYVVVIIDELADLMMVASQEVENTICRLAQMARATGIHLVIATQRPSVNVVTGLIKANVPSRIAFFVQSQIDSRTILDVAGAEKLLGKGDMLFSPVGEPARRLQGVFVSESDIKAVVDWVKKQGSPEYSNEILSVEVEENDADEALPDDVDVLFNQAKDIVQSTKKATTSYLQRKLKIGYNRAARLMDQLEEHQVISAYDEESRARNIL